MNPQPKQTTATVLAIAALLVFMAMPIISANEVTGFQLFENMDKIFKSIDQLNDELATFVFLYYICLLLVPIGGVIAIIGALSKKDKSLKSGITIGIIGVVGAVGTEVFSVVYTCAKADIKIEIKYITSTLENFAAGFWLSLVLFVIAAIAAASAKPATPDTSAPYGSAPYGSAPYGSAPYGSAPYGADPRTSAPYGSDPRTSVPYGSAPYGSDPRTDAPSGTSSGLRYSKNLQNNAQNNQNTNHAQSDDLSSNWTNF